MTDALSSDLGDQDDQQANRNAVAMITLCLDDPDDPEAVAAHGRACRHARRHLVAALESL